MYVNRTARNNPEKALVCWHDNKSVPHIQFYRTINLRKFDWHTKTKPSLDRVKLETLSLSR